jgi:methionyl-tRNA formyltransferase
MRLLFFGTPKFARVALKKLLGSHHEVAAVVTAPDKPKGRGRKVSISDVKELALAEDLEILQPQNLKEAGFLERVKEIGAELFAVVAFRILPEKLYTIPRLGAINLHASILPRYRGAAPIERALMDGATTTGVTTFQIRRKVDTGDLLMTREVKIAETDTYEDLWPRLAEAGADILIETIDGLEAGSLTPQPQDSTAATDAPKITPEDCPIDWQRPAERIINQIRGLAGCADAFSWLGGKRLKILRATRYERANGSAWPGEVIYADSEHGLIIAAGDGAVKLQEVCLEGKKRMTAEAFLNGVRVTPGTKLAAL